MYDISIYHTPASDSWADLRLELYKTAFWNSILAAWGISLFLMDFATENVEFAEGEIVVIYTFKKYPTIIPITVASPPIISSSAADLRGLCSTIRPFTYPTIKSPANAEIMAMYRAKG